MKIKDISNFQDFEGFYLIKNTCVRTAKSGQDYLILTFQDSSGEISGNIWNVNKFQKDEYRAGVIVYVSGTRKDFNGIPQISIQSIRLAKHDDDRLDPKEFRKPSPVDADEIRHEIENSFLSRIDNQVLKSIVEHLLDKYSEKFYSYPAAKSLHHNFESGLAFHTVTMLKVASTLSEIYTNLNTDLLFSAVILHDLGKVIELSGIDATEYTIKGSLIGHIVLIDEEISKAIIELGLDGGSEEIMLLRHMILSHHGKLEFGSPAVPKLIEAEMLHQIDGIDARMMMISTALNATEPGEMSQKVFGLENRVFYKPKM